MNTRSDVNADDATPLVVDVDGTLTPGNLLLEGLARLLTVAPLRALGLLPLLPFRRAFVKRKVAEAVTLPAESLPQNPEVAAEIRAAKAAGRPVHLATGADALAAAPVAEAIGANETFASDGHVNLVGRAKAQALVAAFGDRGFDYMGDERRDLPVWRHARQTIGVGIGPRLRARVVGVDPKARFLSGPDGGTAAYWRALRPSHWSKNVLLFLPLAAAHETALASWLVVLGVFAALSALVSGTYLVNDFFDLPHDRLHAVKRRRPLAAGQLRLPRALGLAGALIAAGLAGAFALSPAAGWCLLLYLALTLTYTLALRQQLFLDLIALAAMFALRVLAGAAAVEVPISAWLVAFCLFLFLALAIAKRTTALRGENAAAGRAYVREDALALTVLGGASSFAAVVVLAFYIQSPAVAVLYERPAALWLASPLLIYWLGRVLLLANRGALNEDPIVFALGDRASWYTALGLLAAFALALP